MTDLELALSEIEARVSKASPGPWKVAKKYFVRTVRATFDQTEKLVETINEVDTQFIAHSRTDIPKLLAALRKAIQQRKEWLVAAVADSNVWRGYEEEIIAEQDAELLAILRDGG